jgi:acyl-CoA synthetase (NDP forming)
MKLEQRIIKPAKKYNGMRIVGPNSLGVIVPRIVLNASFAGSMHLVSYARNLRVLHETPMEVPLTFELDRKEHIEKSRDIITSAPPVILDTEMKPQWERSGHGRTDYSRIFRQINTNSHG